MFRIAQVLATSIVFSYQLQHHQHHTLHYSALYTVFITSYSCSWLVICTLQYCIARNIHMQIFDIAGPSSTWGRGGGFPPSLILLFASLASFLFLVKIYQNAPICIDRYMCEGVSPHQYGRGGEVGGSGLIVNFFLRFLRLPK